MSEKNEALDCEGICEDMYLPGLRGPGTSNAKYAKGKEGTMTRGTVGAQDAKQTSGAGAAKTIETPITAARIKALVGKQGFQCALSGLPLTPDTAGLDHIIPVSKGGSHSMENLQVLHREVNRMKGNLLEGEFIDWCRLLVSRHDRGQAEDNKTTQS